MRIDGEKGFYRVYAEYGTRLKRTSTITINRKANVRHRDDGTSHNWSLTYDPDGNHGGGSIEFKLDADTWMLNLLPGHKLDGSVFDRFGLWNRQTEAGSPIWVYLDNVVLDGVPQDFSSDPGWLGTGNRRTYTDCEVEPRHNFGFRNSNHARGAAAGEVGGILWRTESDAPQTAGYYADTRIGKLNLNHKLFARGKLAMPRTCVDAGLYLGWFNAATYNSTTAGRILAPDNFLGALVESSSDEGQKFNASYRTGTGTYDLQIRSPRLVPPTGPLEWSIAYDPALPKDNLVVTVAGQQSVLTVPDSARKQGTVFNAFGIGTTRKGGHWIEMFFDDVTYTIAGAHSADIGRHGRADAGWKAGLARMKITPERSVVLLGYGDRTGPFQSVAEDIYAKALALEDEGGRRAVIVTADLVGLQAAVVTDEVCRRIKKRTGLERRQLLFNASHSHTGPLVSLDPDPAANSAAHGLLTPDDIRETITYTRQLEDKLVQLVIDALSRMQPAWLAWGAGQVDFPMNRRLRRGDRIAMSENPQGPTDRSVPVLTISASDGTLRAVLFGCACHNTTLTRKHNVIAGDYAGFAQKDVEQRHPTAQAMFVSGCGGDANPYPRGSMDLAQQHGATLAGEVLRILETDLRPVQGRLVAEYAEVKLPLQKLSQTDFEERTKLRSAESVMARHMISVLDRGESLPRAYRAPFAVWQFGEVLTFVALPGEPVADYASLIRQRLGAKRLWVAGYNNDCFGYLPTAQIVREGGHEAIGVTLWIWGQRLRRNAGFFAPEVEQVVLGTVQRLASKSGRPAFSAPPPAKAAAGGSPSSQTEGAPPASRVTALSWISCP